MKYLNVLVVLMLATSCSNKIVVYHVDKTTAAKDRPDPTGKFFYTLPASTFEVECRIKKVEYVRGSGFVQNCPDFIAYGKSLFNMDDKILDRLTKGPAHTVFSLAKDGFSWTQGAVPDDDKIFVFANKKAFLRDNTFAFAFNRDWMLSSGTVTTENKTFEVVSTFLTSVIGTATTILKSNSVESLTTPPDQVCNGVFAPLIKAKAAYDKLLTNPPLREAEVIKMMHDNLQKEIEKQIETLFYKKQEEVTVIRFSVYIPPFFSKDQTIKFFRIDPDNGNLLVNDQFKPFVQWPLVGKQVQFETLTPGLAGYYSIVSVSESRSAETVLADQLPRPNDISKLGIVYNVPKPIRFYVKEEDNPKATALVATVFQVAQLGAINYLPVRVSKNDFVLDSLTGSLLKITSEAKSTLSGQLSSGGAAAQKVDSALKKTSELDKLKKEAEELEIRAKIKELKAKLE